MPARDLDAIFFIDRVPNVSFEDGLFRICYDIGKNARFEIVMRPAVFQQARMLVAEAVAKWQCETLGSENVAMFRRR